MTESEDRNLRFEIVMGLAKGRSYEMPLVLGEAALAYEFITREEERRKERESKVVAACSERQVACSERRA